MAYELTSKKFFEAAGIELELCEDGEWRPKKGFLLDKPAKRITKKSSTLKSLERKTKKNSLKEFFDVAGVLDKPLAQKLIMNEIDLNKIMGSPQPAGDIKQWMEKMKHYCQETGENFTYYINRGDIGVTMLGSDETQQPDVGYDRYGMDIETLKKIVQHYPEINDVAQEVFFDSLHIM